MANITIKQKKWVVYRVTKTYQYRRLEMDAISAEMNQGHDWTNASCDSMWEAEEYLNSYKKEFDKNNEGKYHIAEEKQYLTFRNAEVVSIQ